MQYIPIGTHKTALSKAEQDFADRNDLAQPDGAEAAIADFLYDLMLRRIDEAA